MPDGMKLKDLTREDLFFLSQLVHLRDDLQSLETCPFLRQTKHLPAFSSICLRASGCDIFTRC